MLALPRKYEYNASYKKMTLYGAIIGIVGYVVARFALSNDRGLVIDYFIKLDVNGATIFYWVICFVCVLGCLATLSAMINRAVNPKELAIDDSGITIPHGFMLSKETRINFDEILGLTETIISGQTFLYIYTSDGKVPVAESLLPEKQDYKDIKDYLRNTFNRMH